LETAGIESHMEGDSRISSQAWPNACCKTLDEVAFTRPELSSLGDLQEYELRSVLDVSQVRGRKGKTREKVTFPRILVLGTTVYGVPCPGFAGYQCRVSNAPNRYWINRFWPPRLKLRK
jgi:hypothetical protein